MGDGAYVIETSTHRGPLAALLLAVFALAFGLRWVAVSQFESSHPLADSPVIDEASYEDWALEIAHGDWLGDEVFFQEPLYPYVLGAAYTALGADPPARGAVRRGQAALGALTAALVALLGFRLAGRGRRGLLAGGLAGGLLAVHGPAVLMACLLLKPNLFLPILAVLLLGLASGPGAGVEVRRWLGVGVAAGLGALLRGNLLVMLPWIALWPIALRILAERTGWAKGARETAAVVGGIVLCLLPVFVRNYAVGGEFALSTSGAGTNFYGGNNAENPYGRATEFSFIRGIPEHEAGDWKAEAERRAGRELSGTEVSRFWMGEVWKSVAANPGLHLRILWNKLRLTLGTYEVPDNHGYDWSRRYVSLLSKLPGFGWIGAIGLAGLLAFLFCLGGGASEEQRSVPIAARRSLAVFFLLYLGTIVLTVTSMRARLPLTVLLAPAASLWGIDVFRASFRERRRLAALMAFLLVGVAAVLTPVYSPVELEQDLSKRDFNLAVHLGSEPGGTEAALEIIRRLDEQQPNSSRIIVFRAELEARGALDAVYDEDPVRQLAARETVASALRTLRDVAKRPELSPRERYRANAVGGLLQLELGNLEPARNLLRAALEFDPDAADLLEALARIERALNPPGAETPGAGAAGQ